MKKKIVIAIAVLGMAFAGQMNAQDDARVIGGSGNTGDESATWYDFTLWGRNYYGCAGTPMNCAPEVVVTP